MVIQIYQRAFHALMKQPVRLIGLSLFGSLLVFLGSVLFGIVLGVSIAIQLLLNAALAQIFLRSYRGEACNTQDMFATFKEKGLLKRVLGGMAWRKLWLFIWCLIPIAGIVFYIIKGYQYALTPYILMNENDVEAMQAIQTSKERTKGYRLKMFLADLLVYVLIFLVFLVLGLLSRIPYVGIVFLIVSLVLLLCICALLPLFMGLVHAAFYEEIRCPSMPMDTSPFSLPSGGAPTAPIQPKKDPAPTPEPKPTSFFCPNCGTKMPVGTAFCPNCGTKL